MSINKAISILDDTLKFVRSYNMQSKSIDTNKTEYKSDSNLEWPAQRVRQQFIDFFVEKHAHKFTSSSPVVPLDDPTLLFTNAGMNQFKPIFLGNITDDDPLASLTRACNSQKCIRAGGKHNDLDDVGKDTYHHTFFEMLGNWSFGDYFKEEAIAMAWDLLVNIYGLDKSRMYATYFGGDKSQNLECDFEAKQIWLKYLPLSNVLPFDMCDNFWEMGETGPCGPCTEIHYDRIGNRNASDLVNMDDPTVIEIWNLVFIQFNRNEDNTLQLLPNKHVDTGMGFERITSILQNVLSNYDTDIFMPIISEIQNKTNCIYKYNGQIGQNDINGIDMAYRVVADHIRTLTFAITDGAQPDKQGRNYVIRRICRRGVRYGKKLGGKIGFFKDLVDIVCVQMGDFYPEINKRKEIVKSIIEEEENLFSRTLDNGEKRFLYEVGKLEKENKNEISGEIAFKLYSTFGFPIDLTILMAEEHNMIVNRHEYNIRMDREREDSNKKNNSIGILLSLLGDNEKVYLQNNNIFETNQTYKYEWKNIKCKIVAIFDSNSKSFVNCINENNKNTNPNEIGIILDSTSFYAESGGQINDIGYIIQHNNEKDNENAENAFKVNDVQQFGGYIIHIGEVTNGIISVESSSSYLTITNVDYDNRKKIAPNHTMTHILNFSLRNVLEKECNQKGSLVDCDKLRFDYSTNKSLTINEIDLISQQCNKIINSNLNVYTDIIEYKQAIKINSLRAMFGERYPKYVRVVSVGIKPKDVLLSPNDINNFNYSLELCGGTHLNNTNEAKYFVFLSDDALSAGIRRIVCLTGFAAKRAINNANELCDDFKQAFAINNTKELSNICSLLSYKVDHAKIDAVVKNQLRKQLKILKDKDRSNQKELAKQRKKKVINVLSNINININNNKFIIKRIDVSLDKKALKEGIKKFYKNKKNCNTAIMLISCSPNDKNKIIILAEIPKSMINTNIHCGKWIQCLLPLIDGPDNWRGVKNDTKTEVQGKSMSSVSKVIETATQYMNDNLK